MWTSPPRPVGVAYLQSILNFAGPIGLNGSDVGNSDESEHHHRSELGFAIEVHCFSHVATQGAKVGKGRKSNETVVPQRFQDSLSNEVSPL
jgi:hypothetical protein